MTRLVFNRGYYLSELVRGKTVLDIGCVDHSAKASNQKNKWIHGLLCQTANSVTGIDTLEADVKQLCQQGYNVICADATNFDLNKKFDIIVAGDVLEHLTSPENFLRCCSKHLKKDGKLVLTTPNANCLLYFIENILLGYELDNTDHVCIYTQTTMRTLLRKCQMKMLNVTFESRILVHYQKTSFRKTIAFIMWLINSIAALIRPSLSRHFITEATLQDQ